MKDNIKKQFVLVHFDDIQEAIGYLEILGNGIGIKRVKKLVLKLDDAVEQWFNQV